METVTVRPYQGSDLDSVLRFYSTAFGGDRGQKEEAFRWIQQNPSLTGDTQNYLLMFSDDRLIGYWGLMPARFFCSSVPFPGLFSQEALIDPAYRGEGLGHVLLDAVNRSGRFMISLWHNQRIQAIKTKGRWLNVGWYRPLKKVFTLRGLVATAWRQDVAGKISSFVSPIAARSVGSEAVAAGGFEVEEALRCDREYDELFYRTAAKLGMVSDRTSAILNWKYVDIPHRRYTVLSAKKAGSLRGYLVLRVENRAHFKKGVIVDLLVDPEEPKALDVLLSRCEGIFGQEKVDFSVCVLQTESLRKVFYSRGYYSASSRLTDSCLIFNQDRAPDSGPATRLDRWYLTYGDSDGDMW